MGGNFLWRGVRDEAIERQQARRRFVQGRIDYTHLVSVRHFLCGDGEKMNASLFLFCSMADFMYLHRPNRMDITR